MTYDHEHGAEQFVGHAAPAGKSASAFVYAELSDVGETPIRWEQLPAAPVRVEDGTYEIRCVPFFAYGLALGDIVVTTRLAEHGVVEHVVSCVTQASGHLTFRVQFLRAQDPETARTRLIAELRGLGCPVEEWSPRMIAVDVAPDLASRVEEFLEEGMRRDGFEYERATALG